MRKINLIVIHCSASDNPKHNSISVIRRWHLKRGWSDVGYHWFIKTDGTVQKGREEEKQGAHTLGKNKNSIGMCLHGLLEENFTEAQFNSAVIKIKEILVRYPDCKIDIVPHRLFAKKTCPVFDMLEIFKRL